MRLAFNRSLWSAVICGLLLGPAAYAEGPSSRVRLGHGSDLSAAESPADKARIAVLVDPVTQQKRLLIAYQQGTDDQSDIIVRTSSDSGRTWSEPLNLSSTGDKTTVLGTRASARWPTIGSGKSVTTILWTSTYCPGGVQGQHSNFGPLTAYECVWVSRSVDTGLSWSAPQQLSNGSRDATNIVTFMTDAGAGIAWQEDPQGLQPGEAEGPGDGGSGAKTSPGTDIYYTSLSTSALTKGTAFPAATQVSDNTSEEVGSSAASRPQLRLVGSTAMLAYEESKGGDGEGKNIIWHSFPFGSPPSTAAGDIISDAAENSRRVRIVAQGPTQMGPAKTSAIVFWRQGVGSQGAPADIMLRRATTGYAITDFGPAVNMSGATPDEATGANAAENSRAHRAVMRGDFLAFAYNYTPSDQAATAQLANYNTFLRISRDGGLSWDAARNVSQITDPRINSAEPRLEGTPPTVASGLEEDYQNTDVLVLVWSEESNEADPVPGDIFVRVSTDQGATFGERAVYAGGPGGQREAQFRSTPDGGVFYALWMDDSAGVQKVFYATSMPNLRVASTGDGQGAIVAGGIACGSDCDTFAALGDSIELGVVPAPGSAFAGWGGDPDCLDGMVSMRTTRTCVATFTTRVAVQPGQVRRPDYDGDGDADIASYVPETGALSIHHGDAAGGVTTVDYQWSPGWTVRAAEFNGDGFTDFFLYNVDNGMWFKAINNQSGGFLYISGTWSAGWSVFIMNLDGNDLSDVFLYRPTDGYWFKCLSAADGSFRYVGSGRWSAGWTVKPATLNADALEDLFLYNHDTGVAFWLFNDGGSNWQYQYELWSPGWSLTTADFDGDGRSDVLLYSASSGHYVIGTNVGGWFQFEAGLWSAGWSIAAGDMSGDGRDDLLLYDQAGGRWVQAVRMPGGPFIYLDGVWSPGWQVSLLDLDDDARADVLLFNADSGVWFQALSRGGGVFSYTSGTWSPGASLVLPRQ